MTKTNIVSFEVEDITGIVLECRHCRHTLTLKQPEKQEFTIREDQACPVCGTDWWKPKRGRRVSGVGTDSDPACALIDAFRYAVQRPPEGVRIRFEVRGEN